MARSGEDAHSWNVSCGSPSSWLDSLSQTQLPPLTPSPEQWLTGVFNLQKEGEILLGSLCGRQEKEGGRRRQEGKGEGRRRKEKAGEGRRRKEKAEEKEKEKEKKGKDMTRQVAADIYGQGAPYPKLTENREE